MIKYLITVVTGAILVSCIFDYPESICTDSVSRNIMFTVAVEGQPKTRATWESIDPSQEADIFENKILPGQMRVVVYTDDNIRLGQIDDLSYWPINEDHTEFKFIGSMPEEFINDIENLEEGELPVYKIVVLANCPDGEDQDLTYSSSVLNTEDGAIPMWGFRKADLTPLMTGTNQDIGEILLLRSAAKIKIRLTDELKAENIKIQSASLNYYNQTGYCAPSGWHDDTIDGTEDLDQDACFHLYRHAAIGLPLIKDAGSNDFYVYMPEYDNLEYPEEKARISVTVDIDGTEKTFTDAIAFCRYVDGKPQEGEDYNIIRNHIYEFTISAVATGSLVINYTVADWESELWGTDSNGDDLHYEEHEVTYPTYHNPVVPESFLFWEGAADKFIISETPSMYYNSLNKEKGAFCCYFQITAPADVEWLPSIDASKEQYKVIVYKDFDKVYDSDDMTSALSAWNGWYKILVHPKDAYNVGTRVNLGITYHQNWTDSHINLYINGDYDNIKWPDSGNNPKLISIRHIEQGLI